MTVDGTLLMFVLIDQMGKMSRMSNTVVRIVCQRTSAALRSLIPVLFFGGLALACSKTETKGVAKPKTATASLKQAPSVEKNAGTTSEMGSNKGAKEAPSVLPTAPAVLAPASIDQRRAKADAAVKAFCSRCHAFPDPGQFTMQTWAETLKHKLSYFRKYKIDVEGAPPPAELFGYYAAHAAKTLLVPSFEPAGNFKTKLTPTRSFGLPAETVIADLVTTKPGDGFGGAALLSDYLSGRIVKVDSDGGTETLATLRHPARLHVVDVDGDGQKDIVAAELGTFSAVDHKRGEVVWLRRTGKTFKAIKLLGDIGRVSEVRAGDLNGDGYPDLVVAEFGWLTTGSLTILWNPGGRSTTKVKAWRAEKLDAGRGAVSVRIEDVDGDKMNDIIALFGQEREEVIVYKRLPNGRFRSKRIYEAGNPLWGGTILKLVDADNDGDIDVLVGNGDTLDSPRAATFQGLHLLTNQGGLRFEHRQLAALPGLQDVEIIDYDRDGDLDFVLAASVTPTVLKMLESAVPAGRVVGSLLLLQREKAGEYKAVTLSDRPPCYSALASTKDGDLLIGNFGLGWEILGQTQSVSANQRTLSDCSNEAPLKVWSFGKSELKAEPDELSKLDWRQADSRRLKARVAAFRRLLETEPLRAGYHMGLGISLAQSGEKQEALGVMRKAVGLNPKSPDLHVNVATLLNTMDEYREAVLMADKALKLRKDYPEALNAKSVSLARMARMSEALENSRKAIRLKPRFLPFRFNLANLLMFQQDAAGAVRELDEILTIEPGHPVAQSMKMQLVSHLRGGAPSGGPRFPGGGFPGGPPR